MLGIIALIIIIAVAIIVLGIVCVHNIIDNIIEYFVHNDTTTDNNYSKYCCLLPENGLLFL